MWFQGKSKDKQTRIECPYCGLSQMVTDSISAVFCKGCKKTIFRNSSSENPQDDSAKGNQKLNPSGSSTAAPEKKPEISSASPSIPVKKPNTHSPNSPGAEKGKEASPPKTPDYSSAPIFSGPEQTNRKVRCPHCKVHQEVPSIAVQSFCEHCAQRINLQDYRIEKGNFKGDLETRGEVCVAEGSSVKANLNVGIALIRGTIEGKIIGEKKVEIFPNGLIIGTIESPNFIVHEGGGFIGKATIQPNQPNETK